MASAFDLLHPLVQRRLWDMKWEELRPIQSQAIRHLLGGGGDCIIASPTASGKTEAAFLPVLSAIAEGSGGGIRAMYIGPLKALINDQFRRVEELCARMEMPVHKWHGDVSDADRKAVLQSPAGVLLITPESLEAMFVRRPTQIPTLFRRLGYVVIDELHAFLGSVRGAQLSSQLFRLRARAGCDPVRIGLSATLADPERALKWLRPDGVTMGALITDSSASSQIAIRVRGIWRPHTEPASDDVEAEDASVAEVARSILVACRGATNLVFANSKTKIEELADELTTQAKAMQLPDEVVVHHGSLSKETREVTEERLREDRPCTAVCSNTLEMGIDIGQIDTVVQVAAPWSVSSLVQRLGRSGRRGQERKLRAFFVEDAPSEHDDFWKSLHLNFLQGLATIELMIERFLEPPDTSRAQWSTLVQQLLSTIAETGGIKAAALYPRLFDSRAFAPMKTAEFASLLRSLGSHELIEQDQTGLLILGRLGERLVEDYTFYAAFRAPQEFRVLHGTSPIGTLPETSIPPPGEHVILAGRRWQVQNVDAERREVAVVPSRGRRPPRFASVGGDLHPGVHGKMLALACGNEEPRYLDDGAREILRRVRASTRACDGFNPRIQVVNGHVRLVLFKGTRISRTLLLALLRAELSVTSEGVGLETRGDLEALYKALQAFCAAPNGLSLAAIAEEKLHARAIGSEKYDRFLPDELWRAAYVNEQLDLDGALVVAKELVAEIDRATRRRGSAPRSKGPNQGLDVIAGLSLGGSSLTEVDDLAAGEAVIGRAALGTSALLTDLELRLGLAYPDAPLAVRVARWSARMAGLAPRGRFYSRSYAVDAWGTAAELLAWRDTLIEAGWDGGLIPNAGERLEQLAEVEMLAGAVALPPSSGDRLRTIDEEFSRSRRSVYARVRLVEPVEVWPQRWRRVFDLLREAGCAVEPLRFEPVLAPPTTDLGRMQRHVMEGGEAVRPEGDGTLLFVRGETTWETAHAAAALTRAWGEGAVVIRSGDRGPLDYALRRAGLATQGTSTSSRLRPILQVLPLALELAFEPKDPYRVLELLALPDGPFRGSVGGRLADAIAEMPGIGSTLWNEAKAKIDDEPRLQRVVEWIEAPGHPQSGAPREALIDVVRRVRTWLQGRIAVAAIDDEEHGVLLAIAYRHAVALEETLVADPRSRLALVQLRQVVEASVGAGGRIGMHAEQAGRIDHVDRPGSLLRSRETVLWWSCTTKSAESPPQLPFSRAERDALAAAGVSLLDRRAQMAEAAAGWRRALLAATTRLILVAPRHARGADVAVHPLWDELFARMGGVQQSLASVSRDARDILEGRAVAVETSVLEPSRLPEPRAVWLAPAQHLVAGNHASATSIETLLGCPLRWVLEYRAGLRRGSLVSIPQDHLLYGRLGHRLIQRLHEQHAFALENEALRALALDTLDALLPKEGATLLLPGRRGERAQVRDQLANAAVRLSDALRRGAYQEAQRLPLAYVGTVHAICKRLLTEFALAVGVSPSLDVLPEDASERALNEALEAALDRDHFRRIEDVSRRLRPNWDAQKRRHRWIPDAEDLLELARSNKTRASELSSMAERSILGFAAVVGRRSENGQSIDDTLRNEIDAALRRLAGGDGTQTTNTAITTLTEARRDLETQGELPWGVWGRLSTLQASAAQRDVMAVVNEAAARHREHPLFHDDIAEYIRLVYDAVAKGLSGYATWKEERRYIDYVDMEERALDLLERPEVADDLRRRLQLLVVDEFQDTSPLQLALFLKLDALCDRSVWVGDRKQSIFAFRGADPALMDAVVEKVIQSGGETEVLDTNYRSRKALVDFCSDVFSKAFALHGYRAEDVCVQAKREQEDTRLDALPPLGCWLLEAKTNDEDAGALATGIGRLLANPAGTPVLDRATGLVRDLEAADVAILVATNDEALRLAQALGAIGIPSATPRKRLLETPEGTMLHAALRAVADPADTAARARVEALAEFGGDDPDVWLERHLDARSRKETVEPRGSLARLEAERKRLLQLSPSEAVDELIGELDLCARCMRWPRPEERLANLEAFRALAGSYEGEVEAARAAGSVVGFLHFLDDAAISLREDSDRDRHDDQHAGGADTLQICTYHRAKGLEWPVVILSSLHSKTRAFGIPPDAAAVRLERGGRWQYFSAAPESESKTIDVGNPLAGRWLRFWPWPYGTKLNAELVEDVGRTPESQRLVDAAARESLRLLYVGFTRARDHLIFALRATKKEKKATKTKPTSVEVTLKADWFETIHDGSGALLTLPTGEAEQQSVIVGGLGSVPARVWWIVPGATMSRTPADTRRWYLEREALTRAGYRIAPSRAATDWPEVLAAPLQSTVHTIGPRIPCSLADARMNEVGTAIHAIFAADPMDHAADVRTAVVERLLAGHGFTGIVRPDELVRAHDVLRAWLEVRYSGARWHREVPVVGVIETPTGRREIRGAIDLLLESAAGWVVIDHKTFPGAAQEWQKRAHDHAPQLAAYGRVLSMSSDKPILASFIHLPIGGSLVELTA